MLKVIAEYFATSDLIDRSNFFNRVHTIKLLEDKTLVLSGVTLNGNYTQLRVSTRVFERDFKINIADTSLAQYFTKPEENTSDIEVYENVEMHFQCSDAYDPKYIDSKKPVGIIYTNDDGTYDIVMATTIEEASRHEFE